MMSEYRSRPGLDSFLDDVHRQLLTGIGGVDGKWTMDFFAFESGRFFEPIIPFDPPTDFTMRHVFAIGDTRHKNTKGDVLSAACKRHGLKWECATDSMRLSFSLAEAVRCVNAE